MLWISLNLTEILNLGLTVHSRAARSTSSALPGKTEARVLIQPDGKRAMALFKRDPTKKLKKEYQRKLEAAMHAMRRGDVRNNALLVAEAELIKVQIDTTEAVMSESR